MRIIPLRSLHLPRLRSIFVAVFIGMAFGLLLSSFDHEERHVKGQARLPAASVQPVTSSFVSVTLPPPPPPVSDKNTMTPPERSSTSSLKAQAKDSSTPRPLIAEQNRHQKLIQKEMPRTQDVSSVRDMKAYQTLLQEIEGGSGPDIEIAWPDKLEARERLFKYLHNCMGMRLGKFANGRIVAREGKGSDREFSGIIRVVQGVSSMEERRILERFSAEGTPVRLFSRRFDEALLSGFQALGIASLAHTKRLVGKYQLDNEHLYLGSVNVDGRPIPGNVMLMKLADCHA